MNYILLNNNKKNNKKNFFIIFLLLLNNRFFFLSFIKRLSILNYPFSKICFFLLYYFKHLPNKVFDFYYYY